MAHSLAARRLITAQNNRHARAAMRRLADSEPLVALNKFAEDTFLPQRSQAENRILSASHRRCLVAGCFIMSATFG